MAPKGDYADDPADSSLDRKSESQGTSKHGLHQKGGAPDEQHSKQSLSHILTPAPAASSQGQERGKSADRKSPRTDTPTKQSLVWVEDNQEQQPEDSSFNESAAKPSESSQANAMTSTTTRRGVNGTVGSVYSGNKIKHLKKEDGIPLWRKDIQLEFLRCVFENTSPVFTKYSDGAKNCSFAEIYVDAMARSGKTSKVLKEKMLADHVGAMSMAMICLLVNIGRMNTTLNFFPEMRAQLRTYHAIPSLQAQQDPNSYKQLQDAPRLKSILKGASEDTGQPNTIEKIKASQIPRTNPVNLIFVLQQYAPKISEVHFNAPRDFFDLVMRATLSSKSRATAFLWLMWWYLESDFTAKAALENPFGPGQDGENTGDMPLKVPAFEHLTEEQANAENVDTEEEIRYGKAKQQERRRILEEDETVGPPLRKPRKSAADSFVAVSDNEHGRSPSPPSSRRQRGGTEYEKLGALMSGGTHDRSPATSRYPPLQSKADQSHPPRLALKTKGDGMSGPSQAAPPGSGHPILSSAVSAGHRRPRPETSHQRAVNINRKMRTDHILHRHLLATQRELRRKKRRHLTSFNMLVMARLQECPDMYDSEDENSVGPAGLIPSSNETEEYGDEAVRHKKVVDRAIRRLLRWENGGKLPDAAKLEQRRKRKADEHYLADYARPSRKRRKPVRMSSPTPAGAKSEGPEPAEEGLDDLDLDLLGEGRDGDRSDGDSVGYGSDLPDGDMTEEDVTME